MKSILIQASKLKGENVYRLQVSSNLKIEHAVFVEITEDDLKEIAETLLFL